MKFQILGKHIDISHWRGLLSCKMQYSVPLVWNVVQSLPGFTQTSKHHVVVICGWERKTYQHGKHLNQVWQGSIWSHLQNSTFFEGQGEIGEIACEKFDLSSIIQFWSIWRSFKEKKSLIQKLTILAYSTSCCTLRCQTWRAGSHGQYRNRWSS